jgi:hypothetical protein
LAATAQNKNPRNASARRDPPPRRVDRTAAWGAIKNSDPTKKYVWVYKASQHGGIGYYENMGYEVEMQRTDGPFCVAARKGVREGQPVEFMDNVLMSIDIAEAQLDYEAGQAEVDELESRIIRASGGVDTLRGIQGVRGRDGSPVLSFENKTSGPQVELEQ